MSDRIGSDYVVHRCRIGNHEAHRGPMIGGICTSFILELLVYPAIYAVWRERGLKSELGFEEAFVTSYLESEPIPNAASPVRIP